MNQSDNPSSPTQTMKVKVAVIQLHSTPLDIEANFDKACAFIRQAAAQQTQIAVLPEYHLNGYLPENAKYIEQASQSRVYLEKYCSLAKELSIFIVPGTIIERHSTKESTQSSSNTLNDADGDYHLFNVAYLISAQGKILGSYSKKNLWDGERLHQSRGQEKHSAIDTPFGKIGLLICWDLAFPEAFRELIRDGADIIVIPTCWTLDESSAYGLKLNPNYESLVLNSMIVSRCFENTCAIVFANSGGPADVNIGMSQVAMPFIGPVGGCLDNGEGMLCVEIDTQVLKEAESNYKVREDIGSEGWHYGYS